MLAIQKLSLLKEISTESRELKVSNCSRSNSQNSKESVKLQFFQALLKDLCCVMFG